MLLVWTIQLHPAHEASVRQLSCFCCSSWCRGVLQKGLVVSVLKCISESAVPAAVDAADFKRCKVPDFAKAMGHEAKWKLHKNAR